MAFPTVQANTSSEESVVSTIHTVSLPTGISAGDLLLVFTSIDSQNETVTFPAGWTKIADHSSNSGVSSAFAYREADGTEGTTIDATTVGTEKSVHTSYRITGAEVPSTQAPEVSTGTDATNTSAPDPDSLTPAGGAADFLWFAITAIDGRGTDVTDYPINYTNTEYHENSTGGGAVAIGIARRENNAASEDPGAFTLDGNTGWEAATLVVHPSSAGAMPSPSDTVTIAEAVNPNLIIMPQVQE